MSVVARAGFREPFGQRNFRFQWGADLLVSWAFEMENLILGWYVLTATGSVLWLTAFAALGFTGALISPLFGVAGDRVGHRMVLAAMRASYVVISAILALLALLDAMTPVVVFALATLSGLVRPSDLGMRNALVASTMPPALLASAISIGRVSMDSARVIGALTGAGLGAVLGVGPTYAVVVALYLVGVLLIRAVREPPRAGPVMQPASLASTVAELGDGMRYARATPGLLALLALACLTNFAAYPLSGGLLPHVARDVYGIDRTGLGYLSASFASGALVGSLLLTSLGMGARPGRLMFVAGSIWCLLLLVFAQVRAPLPGMVLLLLAGCAQSFCMVPISVLLLRRTATAFRGRVMGLRMLAIYGLPVGLLLAGPAIAALGFAATATIYAGFALVSTLAIGWHWRAALWRAEA